MDDVNDVTEMLHWFKHAGYDVTTANSAGNALELAGPNLRFNNFRYRYEMNGMNWRGCLRLSRLSDTPLIAVTGYTDTTIAVLAASGFDAHLTKPINPCNCPSLSAG